MLPKINDLTMKEKYSGSPTGVDLDHSVGEKRRSMVVNELRSLVSGYVYTLVNIARDFRIAMRAQTICNCQLSWRSLGVGCY